MSVKQITTDDLRKMKGKEGLILQGCGGSIDNWINSINDLLTESGILLDGTKFKSESCYVFKNEALPIFCFRFLRMLNSVWVSLLCGVYKLIRNSAVNGCPIM